MTHPPAGHPAPPTGDYQIPPSLMIAARPGPPRHPVGPDGRPLAEWWERLLARMLDNLILSAVLFVGELIGALPMVVIVVATDENPTPVAILIGGLAWFVVIGLCYAIGTYLYEVTLFGGARHSIGKRVLKLAVVSVADGSPPDRATRRRRWLAFNGPTVLGYLLLPLLPVAWVYQMYDVLCPLWRPSRQAVHDRYAGTTVVKEGR